MSSLQLLDSSLIPLVNGAQGLIIIAVKSTTAFWQDSFLAFAWLFLHMPHLQSSLTEGNVSNEKSRKMSWMSQVSLFRILWFLTVYMCSGHRCSLLNLSILNQYLTFDCYQLNKTSKDDRIALRFRPICHQRPTSRSRKKPSHCGARKSSSGRVWC